MNYWYDSEATMSQLMSLYGLLAVGLVAALALYGLCMAVPPLRRWIKQDGPSDQPASPDGPRWDQVEYFGPDLDDQLRDLNSSAEIAELELMFRQPSAQKD
jgi:hypothetical protein